MPICRSKNFAFRNKSCLESGSGCIPIRQVIGCNVKVIAADVVAAERKKKQNQLLRNRNRTSGGGGGGGNGRSVAPYTRALLACCHLRLLPSRLCRQPHLLIRTKVSQGLYVCGIHTHTARRERSASKTLCLTYLCLAVERTSVNGKEACPASVQSWPYMTSVEVMASSCGNHPAL